MSKSAKIIDKIKGFVLNIAELGNKAVHAIYKADGQPKYRPVKESITSGAVRDHLTDTQPIGCYFVSGTETHVAVLDFDDHDNEMDWSEMIGAAKPVVAELTDLGLKPFCCRSGGGAGLHIWLFWQRPQNAKLLKAFLRNTISNLGYEHGTLGVQSGQIEIFPKNDQVKKGGLGSLVALPFARNSVPLDSELMDISWEDFEPPEIEELYCPDVDTLYSPPTEPAVRTENASPQNTSLAFSGELLPGDEGEAAAALKHVSADDYETWVKIGLAVKASFGEAGFVIWDEWSKSSTKYGGAEQTVEKWASLEPDGSLTIGTIFHLAKEKGWDGPSNAVIRDMNSRFGILTHGSATRIILKQNETNEVLSVLGKQAFEDRLAPEKFPVTDSQGNTKWVPKSRYWLQHHLAAHYHRVDFDPSLPPGHNGNTWNVWRGFAVKPVPGDWSKLKGHIYENVCGEDRDRYDWLMNWMALGVQQPALVIGTAPVLKGLPGTGKGVLANAYGHLWMPHFVSITKDEHVRGRFNQHLEGKRLVFFDEATFGGDRKNAGVIKTMLTEPQIMIERKGIDPIWLDNHMMIMVASNERSVVPADIGDRRWQVFEVSSQRREDKAYFSGIFQQLRNGGYEAMLHELLQRDIDIGPDPRKIIRTPELFDQIIQAQGPVEKYLYRVLDFGYLPQPDAPGNGAGITTIAAMYADLMRTQPNAQYVHETLFGRDLGKIFTGLKKVQSGKFVAGFTKRGEPIIQRSMRYHFPPLSVCRTMFEDYIGQPIPWSEEVTEWLGDIEPPYDYGELEKGREPPF